MEKLAEVFDGRQQVTYEVGAGTLPLPEVVDAANERCYDVTSILPHPNRHVDRSIVTFRHRLGD